MAITTVPRFMVPSPWTFPSGGWGLATGANLNASGDRFAFVGLAPKAGVLHSFEFRVAFVTNQPDNGIRGSFQDVSATTGDPDGTQDHFRDYTGSLTANTWQTFPGAFTNDGTNGGTKRTVAQGEPLACVADFVSFTASDSWGPSVVSGAASSMRNWYFDNGDTGSYVKGATNLPLMALKYDDGTYGEFDFQCWPILTVNTGNYGTGSTPDEKALRFQVPVSMRCIGAWALGDFDADFDFVLYDSGSSVLTSISCDPEHRIATNAGINLVYFPSSITLSAATTYRLCVKPTTASTITIQEYTLPGAAYQACIPGGVEWYLSTRTDAGSWTDSTDHRPMIGLIFDGVDAAGGSSGTPAAAFFG